jgi:hypothetical protein
MMRILQRTTLGGAARANGRVDTQNGDSRQARMNNSRRFPESPSLSTILDMRP